MFRGLLLKLNDPIRWKQLMRLESHNEIRKVMPLWRENAINVVAVLLKEWNLQKYFTEDEVHTVSCSSTWNWHM